MPHADLLLPYLGPGGLKVLRWIVGVLAILLVPSTIAYLMGPEKEMIAKGTRLFWVVLLLSALELLACL